MHFVIHRVISSVLSNGYSPSFFISPYIRKKIPFFCLYLFSQASGYSRISISRNYSETSVPLLYSSYIMCLFLHLLSLLTPIKCGPARAVLLMIFKMSHPPFSLHWHYLLTSNQIYVLEIF